MTAQHAAIGMIETGLELRGLALVTHIACPGVTRETLFEDRVAPGDEQMAASVVRVS